MKKRLLALTVAMIMTASTLVACGGGDDTTAPATGDTTETTDGETTGDDTATGDDTTTEPAVEEDPAEEVGEISGDPSAADAFVVWGWNTDIQNILDNVYATADPDGYARIVFVNTGGSDTYQTKIDAMLGDTANELYPDLMGLEVDYVQKYVNSEFLLTADDLGITADEMANMYQYNIDLGTGVDGATRAFFWQATPGCFQVRADLAETYFGTTDPQEIHDTYFCDVDTIIATAQSVWEQSGGKVALFSGYDEMVRMFQNSRTVGWYDENDVITIDAQMQAYMDTAVALQPYVYGTAQWSADWYANMDGDGVETNAAIAYCGCPWFTYWCLSATWAGNTILVEGPEQFFWGGTGLAATVGCADVELAANIIRLFTTDQDFMTQINALNGDFVNNKAAVEAIIAAGNDSCAVAYGDQATATLAFFLPLADSIDASTVTAEDQTINSL
jgi:hypothetical protein